ncbi:MAG TPA: murein biosynthesis integral membrane protein MurJ [Longimicrobium sp.]|nr:murein biosynthesis integral membrane protein MurJ [Longimicrobium sp.]
MNRDPQDPVPQRGPVEPDPDDTQLMPLGREPIEPDPDSTQLMPAGGERIEADPDDTQLLPEPGPEAIEAGALSADEADDAVEPAAAVPKPARSSTAASAMVAAGILLSRIAGLVRLSVFARYFGTSQYADVFSAGLRMPNVLQNLLGEGTLSASFIPVYSELLHQGRKKEAGQVAGAVFALMLAAAGVLALFGILMAPVLVSVFLPGFEGERRELTIRVVRIIFPMTGILVLSAWSLGILNSHRNFFLSYFAPVLWNAAMIATLVALGGSLTPDRLVMALAWGALAGGALQFLVQLPKVLRLNREIRVRWAPRMPEVRETLRNAGPAVMGKGVVQISAYLDNVLASFLAAGAVSTLQYAQTLYILPISLFGMSVAAAELPELARQRSGGGEVLRERASAGLERIAFYVVPSFIAFAVLGDVVIATLLQRGEFDRADTLLVYVTLLGFSLGLIATTASRLLSSTFFALRDTKTPARYATLRVVISLTLSIILMLQFESVSVAGRTIPAGLFSDLRIGGAPLGPVGLALASGAGAWVEWYLLKRSLRKRIGPVGAGAGPLSRMFAAALAGAALGWGVRLLLPDTLPTLITGVLVLGVYGVTYFAVAGALGLSQAGAIFRRVKGMLGRR